MAISGIVTVSISIISDQLSILFFICNNRIGKLLGRLILYMCLVTNYNITILKFKVQGLAK